MARVRGSRPSAQPRRKTMGNSRPLGLVDGREAEHVLLGLGLLVRGFAVEQGHLGDEVADVLELRGEADEALEVLFAVFSNPGRSS